MRRLAVLLVGMSLVTFLFGCGKTVATVNGESITQQQLDQQLELADGKNMLETLIARRLVEQDALAKHASVSDQEVDAQLQDLKKTLSPADQQAMTPEKLKLIRDEIRFNILLRKAIMANVTDADIKAFYEKNKDVLPEVELSAIVVGDQKQAQAILDELHRAKEFETMARQFSLDPAGRDRGGYVGYTSKGNLQQLSPQLAAAAFTTKVGDVSPMVKTAKGYYILKVLNKRDTFDELRNEIERQMAADRAKKYLDQLREGAKIDYKGEYAKK